MLGAAIQAIEQTGTTDREKIGQVGRSGQLEWEAPAGLSRWEADGLSNLPGFLVQMVDKQLVFVEKLER